MRRRAFLWCGWIDERLRDGIGQIIDPPRIDPTSRDFVASVHDIEMAAEAAARLGVGPEDVWAFVCREDLLPQGFRGHWHLPEVAALRRVSGELAPAAMPGDQTLFLATNHGSAEGLAAYAPAPDPFADYEPPPMLRPETLRACLDLLPGQQVVIIGTCHAGVFLDLGVENRRVVLAASDASQAIFTSRDEQARTPFLEQILSGWTGVTVNAVASPERLDLDAAFQAAAGNPSRNPRDGSPIAPARSGSAIWR